MKSEGKFKVASLLRKALFTGIITCVSLYLCWCLHTLPLQQDWVVQFAAAGCHGEHCTKPDREEIRAEVCSDILVHFGMLYLSLGSKIMGKAKQIITGSALS